VFRGNDGSFREALQGLPARRNAGYHLSVQERRVESVSRSSMYGGTAVGPAGLTVYRVRVGSTRRRVLPGYNLIPESLLKSIFGVAGTQIEVLESVLSLFIYGQGDSPHFSQAPQFIGSPICSDSRKWLSSGRRDHFRVVILRKPMGSHFGS
jgi:hypothetical protein